MKKVLVTALAFLTVFAMVGCSEPEESTGGGGFKVPSDWVGFSDAEMLAGKFYIGYGGENPTTTSITKKGSGFEVKIKTLTNNEGKQSVVWFNFDTTVFVKGYYVSLTLPTAGGNARPLNVFAYPIPQGSTSGSSGVVWNAGQDAATNTGDLPATFDGNYVVGDLSMHWGNEAATAGLTGMSLWFQWDADVTLANNDQDYVFTVNTIKVMPGEGPPPVVGVEPVRLEAYLQEYGGNWGGTWNNKADVSPIPSPYTYASGAIATPTNWNWYRLDFHFGADAVGEDFSFTITDVKANNGSGVNVLTEAEILAGHREGTADSGYVAQNNIVTKVGNNYKVTTKVVVNGTGGMVPFVIIRENTDLIASYGFTITIP